MKLPLSEPAVSDKLNDQPTGMAAADVADRQSAANVVLMMFTVSPKVF